MSNLLQVGGGIDYVQEAEPTPSAGDIWAKINTDNNGNPVDFVLKISEGNVWVDLK